MFGGDLVQPYLSSPSEFLRGQHVLDIMSQNHRQAALANQAALIQQLTYMPLQQRLLSAHIQNGQSLLPVRDSLKTIPNMINYSTLTPTMHVSQTRITPRLTHPVKRAKFSPSSSQSPPATPAKVKKISFAINHKREDKISANSKEPVDIPKMESAHKIVEQKIELDVTTVADNTTCSHDAPSTTEIDPKTSETQKIECNGFAKLDSSVDQTVCYSVKPANVHANKLNQNITLQQEHKATPRSELRIEKKSSAKEINSSGKFQGNGAYSLYISS